MIVYKCVYNFLTAVHCFIETYYFTIGVLLYLMVSHC